MNPTHPAFEELESLAARGGWIDGLARGLVADAHLAEDLVQDAWVEALQHGGSARTSLSAWMAGTVKRLASNRVRSSARRLRREAEGARPEVAPPVVTGSERLEQQALLIEHVLGLEEPYRAAIVARYVDELAPREIARRQGVPVATVNSRLTRGLAQLRESLVRAHGGDQTRWLAAMVSLATVDAKDGVVLLGALLMQSKLALVSALFLVLVGGWWTASVALDSGLDSIEPISSLTEALAPHESAPVTDEREPAVATSQRRSAEAAPAASAGFAVEPWTVRLIDGPSGAPVPGAELFVADRNRLGWAREFDARAQRQRLQFELDGTLELVRLRGTRHVADPGGEVIIDLPRASVALFASEGGSRGYLDGGALEGDETELLLWPLGRVEVRVVDDLGHPVSGVQVAVRSEAEGGDIVLDRARSDAAGDASLQPWLVRDDPVSGFSVGALEVFVDLPLSVIEPAPIELDGGGSASATLVVPATGSVVLELSLTPGEPVPDGTPVALDQVSDGWRALPRLLRGGVTLETMEEGEVRFPRVGLGLELEAALAIAPYQDPWEARVKGPTAPGEEVRHRLVLDARKHEYFGVVTEGAVRPLAETEVTVTYSGPKRSGHQWRELSDGDGRLAFELLGMGGAPEGELRFEPVREGGTRVAVVLDMAALTGPGPHDLGRIHFDPEPLPVVSGHVLDPDGRPVADVWVSWTTEDEDALQHPAERTDADGRFTFYGEFGAAEAWLTANTRQRWRHEPQRITGPAGDIELRLQASAEIAGRLIADESVDLGDLALGLWNLEQGPPRARVAHGWKDYGVNSDGSFQIAGLEPGDYALEIDFVMGGGKLVNFDRIEVRPGGPQDPRLDPIDLRGHLRTIRVDVLDDQGTPVIADIWLVPERGRSLALGRGPELVIDERAEGHLLGLVGPGLPAVARLGAADEYRLSSPVGEELRVSWAGEEPIETYGARFELELVPQPDVLAAAGGGEPLRRALALSRRSTWLRAEGTGRLVLPGPGRYAVSWRSRVETPQGTVITSWPEDLASREVVHLVPGERDLRLAPDETWARSRVD